MVITDSKSEVSDDVARIGASSNASNEGAGTEKHVQDDAKQHEKADGENVFSDENIRKDTVVDTGVPKEKDIYIGDGNVKVTITPEDKVAFVDSIVRNERFTKEYSLLGGSLKLTVRSMTSDEVNAVAAWTARQGAEDPVGMMVGRYRKYLAAAQVSKLNGVEMPPLDEPLFPRVGKDGKTVDPPGWMNRFAYWDGMVYGLFMLVMKCINDFELTYSELCRRAEDVNFWNPDTP